MNSGTHLFVQIDLLPMIAAVLAALTCGLLGNFLVLRRQSLMGDAISHAVLPGLVAAFLITGSRNTFPMLIGAAIAGAITVALVAVIRRFGRVEQGAAMGVVFSVLFALGVLMLQSEGVHAVDLDANCVLYGDLQSLFWNAPDTWSALISFDTLQIIPRQIWTLAGVLLATLLFLSFFFKELRIASFDPGLSTAVGINAGLMHTLLMFFVAIATVAAFEAVGSILVVAMLICPAATARLLTDRLLSQILVSAALAIITGAGGYLLGAFGPRLFGSPEALSAAGMMTTLSGALLVIAIIFAPRHGILMRAVRRTILSITITREDILGLLFRAEEMGNTQGLTKNQLGQALHARWHLPVAIRAASKTGELDHNEDAIQLTGIGRRRASSVIRQHRLWETYLVNELGLRPDHVHEPAEMLEHLQPTTSDAPPLPDTKLDPHNREIPPAN